MNIAFVGKLGSGKSTAAKVLEQDGWRRFSWADAVRDIFGMAFEAITPENYATIKATKYLVLVNGVQEYRTGRELLQRIGTDAMRDAVDQNFWLRVGGRRIEDLLNNGWQPIVNDDTRFQNEAANLRERGFKLVRIVRPGFGEGGGTGSIVNHPSEVEQDSIAVDFTITNAGTIADLALKVRFYVHSLSRQPVMVGQPASHEVVSEEWGTGDGATFALLGDRYVNAGVEYRGKWPPDTRVAGRLTCCGATEHTLDCPQWR